VTDTSKLFSGILSAALTPMTADLKPDHAMNAAHCKWLLENGCDGLAILGTTGEANSFSVAERIEIIQSLIENDIPADVMMPGTGCCSAEDTINLTRFAVNSGAPGVLMLPPFYYKNVSDEGLFASFSEVIQKIGDSRLKIYLYHFPNMSQTPISLRLIEMLIKEYPDTVVGMKDSSGEWDNLVNVRKEFPDFVFLTGADNLLLPLLENGGHGCITACSNISASLSAEIYAGYKNGADVSDANEKLNGVRSLLSQFVLFPALKHLMNRHTGNENWMNIRPPLTMLDEAKVQQLYAGFDAIGYDIPKVP